MTPNLNGILLKKGESVWHKKRKFQILATDGAVYILMENGSTTNDKWIVKQWLRCKLHVEPTILFSVHDSTFVILLVT